MGSALTSEPGPVVARFCHVSLPVGCPELRVHRKEADDRQNEAIDPQRTLAAQLISPTVPIHRRTP